MVNLEIFCKLNRLRDCLNVKRLMKDLMKEETKKTHPETLILTRDTLDKKVKNHYNQSGIKEIQPQSRLSAGRGEGGGQGRENENSQKSFSTDSFTWKQWFRFPSFYLYGFVYMGSRVLVNVQSVSLSFFPLVEYT